jgi:hypothetical protein
MGQTLWIVVGGDAVKDWDISKIIRGIRNLNDCSTDSIDVD